MSWIALNSIVLKTFTYVLWKNKPIFYKLWQNSEWSPTNLVPMVDCRRVIIPDTNTRVPNISAVTTVSPAAHIALDTITEIGIKPANMDTKCWKSYISWLMQIFTCCNSFAGNFLIVFQWLGFKCRYFINVRFVFFLTTLMKIMAY